jgi:putative CocE/NonD family hydrolase
MRSQGGCVPRGQYEARDNTREDVRQHLAILDSRMSSARRGERPLNLARKGWYFACAAPLFAFVAACHPRPDGNDSRPAEGIVFERNVDVTMRDGVRLRADLLRPAGPGPFPTLVYRTPYDKEKERRDYTTFQRALERGYALVVEDVRGRYASEGEFRPYQQEGHDGYDSIEWAAAQPWSNGAVGTFGLSYPGAAQWLAAVEAPPHLKAMVPAMTFASQEGFVHASGALDMSWIGWVWNEIAPDSRRRHHVAGPQNTDDTVAAWRTEGPAMLGLLPLARMERLRDVAPFYYEWLRHPPDDPWWAWLDLRGRYGRTKAAVLNLSGWYDEGYGDEGAVINFLGLVAARHGRAADVALILGPWVHGVEDTGKSIAAERRFADNAKIDYDGVVLDWMDHYLRGANNGVGSGKPIRYYVMGADIWREATGWPPAAVRTAFYLGQAAPRRPGLLSPSRQGRGSSAFISDPAHPVTNTYDDLGAHDYRDLALRKDLLTFDSAPLAADTEVTGPIEARVFVSCTCRDFDLWVRLYDVAPDGAAFNLMSPGPDVVRASYRDKAKGRQLLRPGQLYELDVGGAVTSNLFKQGHHIRVQLSGAFFPDFSRNLQTGESEVTSSTFHKARIRIHHDPMHASSIVLPIVGSP